MRIFSILTCILILNLSCFSQKQINPEFDVFESKELNYRYITVYRENNDWISQYVATVKTSNDTIKIPKTLFSGGSELHSERWAYLNCDKICNGLEIDFYSNGNKRIEGNFKNGKPIKISFFRKEGTIEREEFYNVGDFRSKKTNHFNEKGDLIEYVIRKKRRRKIIVKTFDKNDKLINREVEQF